MEAIAIRLEAIASRLEAIASRLEAIASRLEAIASRLEAIASRLEAIASGWRPLLVGSSRLEAIASRLEAIASRLEAIASRLEAIASRLEAIASRLEAIASRLEAIASRLEAIASGWRPLLVGSSRLEAIASRLKAIASRLEAIASRLEAIASRLEAIASRLEAIASRLEAIASRLEAIASRLEAIAVQDTCGLTSGVLGFPNSGLFSTSSNDVISVPVSAAGGLYRLCWCAEKKDIPGYTTDASSCATDFGSLHLLGPLLEQHSTCVSGQSCLLPDMSFFGGTAGPSMTPLPGKLAVLETCGVASRVRGFPLSQLPLSNSENPIGDFYSDQISTAGGQYSLCWCAATPGPCLEDDEFLVSVGHIYIIGPHQLLQKTCISGQKCRLDGLLGTSISDEDSLLIADTCGTYTSLIPQAVNAGLATELPSGKIAMWGREAMTSAGGQYRMCWCSRLSRCSESTDFVTDMGSLVIVGPTPLHLERTCLAGFDCTIDLAGKYLSNGDQMLLSETCGVASSPVPAFQAVHLTVTLGFGALVSWDNDLEMPGSYRLCWCSTESPCLVAEDFKTDVGMLTVVGLGLQDKTCVSGLPCNIDISESSISPEDHFLVMQTCGTIDGAIDGFPGAVSQVGSNEALLSWGRFLALPVTAAGGLYRLCWCPRPNTLSKSQELVASCGDSARPTVSLPFLPNAIT